MNDELRDRLGRFSEALAQLAECLATQEDPRTVELSPAWRDCMTRKQLADYFQVSEQAITNWQNRADHPLPCGYAGDKPRYFLSDVKQWSIEEAQRRSASHARRAKKTTTETRVARKLSSTLTAATKRKRGSHASLQTVQGPAN
jgi:transposase